MIPVAHLRSRVGIVKEFVALKPKFEHIERTHEPVSCSSDYQIWIPKDEFCRQALSLALVLILELLLSAEVRLQYSSAGRTVLAGRRVAGPSLVGQLSAA